MQIQENVRLAPMTTFGIGGEARFFARAQSLEDIQEAVAFAHKKQLPFFVLGGGSNVLIADEGFAGLVIKIELAGIELEEEMVAGRPPKAAAPDVLLIASAGESWDGVVLCSIQENLWGIENLSGIPGSVGGAIVQNIGAYGQAISERIDWVEVFDCQTGAVKRMTAEECAFDYRDSFFKNDNGRHVVLRAALKLSTTPAPNLSYRDLKIKFDQSLPKDGPVRAVLLAEIREAVLAIRKGKFPDLTKEGSAGSFFKNPMLPRAEAEKLQAKHPKMPLFSVPETTALKIPLAWLLDRELHLNGFRLGSARLFEAQPLVIAADRGGASAKDVVALAETVKQKVRENFGIEIEEEVKILENL